MCEQAGGLIRSLRRGRYGGNRGGTDGWVGGVNGPKNPPVS